MLHSFAGQVGTVFQFPEKHGAVISEINEISSLPGWAASDEFCSAGFWADGISYVPVR